MNPINFFKFLEKTKGKPIPLIVKLVQGLPINHEDLEIKGDLDLFETDVTSLPQSLRIKGDLILHDTLIKSLPRDLKVEGHLDIQNTKISSLPPDLQVTRNIYIFDTPLERKNTSDNKIKAMLTTGYIKGEIKRNEYS